MCLNESLSLISNKYKYISTNERIKQYYLENILDYSCYYHLKEVSDNLEQMMSYFKKYENVNGCTHFYESERIYEKHYNFDIGEYNTKQSKEEKCK